MHQGCKCCTSPSREYIDREISMGRSGAAIVRELVSRGENITKQNLSTHKARHYQPPPDPATDRAVESLKKRLEREMEIAATPTAAAAYLMLLRQLEVLKTTKTTPELLLKSIEAVNRITGLSAQQAGLLEYVTTRKWDEGPMLRAVPDERG